MLEIATLINFTKLKSKVDFLQMQLIGTTVFAKRINAKFIKVFGLKMFYTHERFME